MALRGAHRFGPAPLRYARVRRLSLSSKGGPALFVALAVLG